MTGSLAPSEAIQWVHWWRWMVNSIQHVPCDHGPISWPLWTSLFCMWNKQLLAGLFKLTGFHEDIWNKIHEKYLVLLGRKVLHKSDVLLKKKQIYQGGLGKPKYGATGLKNASQDGVLPAEINDVAFPLQHGLLDFIICKWNDLTACSFSSFSFFSPYLIKILREPNCSSNGLLCATLLAALSDAAYRAVLIWPRPVHASQV